MGTLRRATEVSITFATVGTLWLVPLLYSIAVRDLKVVAWDRA